MKQKMDAIESLSFEFHLNGHANKRGTKKKNHLIMITESHRFCTFTDRTPIPICLCQRFWPAGLRGKKNFRVGLLVLK